MVYAIKFWHQIEFVTDYVKISALYTDWWVETIRMAFVHIRTLRRIVRRLYLLSEVIKDGISLPEVGRDICSCVNCLMM